jgi:hypothetical protein
MAEKFAITEIEVHGAEVVFTAKVNGQISQAETNPLWVISALNVVVKCRVSILTLAHGWLRSWWIKRQNQLRECSKEFVEGIVGKTFTQSALETTLSAAVPKKASGIAERDARIAELEKQIAEMMKALQK